jgi:hypothetical protein
MSASEADRGRKRPPRGLGTALLGGTLLLTLLLSLAQVRDHVFLPLAEFDTEERAGSARQLLETGRWSDNCLREWELVGHAHVAEGRPWPVGVWSLGYPLLLAAGFALFGLRDAVAVGLPILGFPGCVALAFWLARRLWGLRVAALTCLLLLVENDLIYWSARGALEPVYTVCVLGAVCLVLLYPRRVAPALAAGALIGMAYFLRPTATAWVPFLLLAGLSARPAASSPRRWPALLAAAGGLAAMLLIAVTLTRALSVPPLPTTGLTISYTQALVREFSTYQVHSGSVGEPQALSWRQILTPRALAHKVAVSLVYTARDLVAGTPLILLILGPLGMWLSRADRRLRALSWCLLLAMVLVLAATVMTAPSSAGRYFSDFVPLLAIFAALSLLWLWRRVTARAGRAGQVLYLVVVAALLLQPFANHRMPFHRVHPQSVDYYLGRAVAEVTPPDAVIGSGFAVQICWHAHRRGIHLARRGGLVTAQDLLQADRDLFHFDALVLDGAAFPASPPQRLGPFALVKTVAVPARWRTEASSSRGFVIYRRETAPAL